MKKSNCLMIFALIFSTFLIEFNQFAAEIKGVNLEIVDFYSCDEVGNPQYYFPVKAKAYFNITIRNSAINPRNVSVYLYAKDSLDVVIGSDELNTAIPANASAYYIMDILIPKWAFVGPNATAQVSLFEEGIVVDNDTINFFIDQEDKTPPAVNILSPENSTYTLTFVPLTFIINERTSVPWISYCLDSIENTTITGNTTLTNLSNGLHSVIVYANDTSDNTGSSNKIYFTVFALHDPVANFTYSPPYPKVCEAVTFNASSSTSDGGCILLYKWDFGDGDIATLSDPIITHHYTTFGNYTIILTVIDNYNLTDSEVATVNVRMHPVASFVYSPLEPLADEAVSFNASASTPNGGSIISFDWNFGDGFVASTSNPTITHSYMLPGRYNVTLTVTDSEELNNTTWDQILIYIHAIAITNITTSKTIVGQGYSLHINVIVANQGNYTEEIDVTIYFNGTNLIATQLITLTSENSTTITFIWETTDVAYGNHTLNAYAAPVLGEKDVSNNALTDGTVFVTTPGDVNGDRKCDVKDVYQLILHFGCWKEKPCYEPNYDITDDGNIDMEDIYITILYFGETIQ